MTNENPRGLPVAWMTAQSPFGVKVQLATGERPEHATDLVTATDYAALLAEVEALRDKVRSAGEAFRTAREYVAAELESQRDKFKGYEHCSDIDSVTADLAALDAAISAMEGRECETCKGGGTVDMTLGGYSFSDPEAICPDCDGSGEAGFRKGPL